MPGEIERCVAALAALVERPSRTFAYPNGSPEDFDDTVAGLVRSAGIECAVDHRGRTACTWIRMRSGGTGSAPTTRFPASRGSSTMPGTSRGRSVEC
jgi:hypothetical protein